MQLLPEVLGGHSAGDAAACDWRYQMGLLPMWAVGLSDEAGKRGATVSWQPIETAPKDGTEVWLWRRDAGVFLGRYTCMLDYLTEAELEPFDRETIEQMDWFYADFVSGGRVTDGEPTHWHPLPEEPDESEVKA